MTRFKANDNARVAPAKRHTEIIDDESASTRQSRWTYLLVAATAQINARDSPLLRLPIEIRSRIYGYVLGYQYIYPGIPLFLQDRHARLPRLVCDCDGARDQNTHSRTYACWAKPLHLDLFFTCRQIYTEAYPIFWATNIFCFEDSWIMLLTFQALLPRQKSLIKNLRLDLNHLVRDNEWYENCEGAEVMSLEGLQRVQLCTFTPAGSVARQNMIGTHRVFLAKLIMSLLHLRPSPIVVIKKNGRVYRQIGKRSKIGKLLESL